MNNEDLSSVRSTICDGDGNPTTSVNNVLDLRFLPRPVIEQWLLARSVEEVSAYNS